MMIFNTSLFRCTSSRIEEMGSILTSDRVIMYFEDGNEDIAVYELYFVDITDV